MSLPQNVTLLPQDLYQIGTHQAPVQAVPTGAANLTLAATMAPSDQENTANSITVQVQTSIDGGQNYGPISSYEFMGGMDPRNPGSPNPFFYQQGMAGITHVKVAISLPQSLSVEIDGTFS